MALHQKTHPVYVEGCFGCKAATLRIGYCGQGNQDATAQKRWDKELDLYASARKQGIQPDTTSTRSSQAALDWSERTGKAYSEEAKQEHNKTVALERFAV
jgi:hypothetical protein